MNLRRWVQSWLVRAARALTPRSRRPEDVAVENHILKMELDNLRGRDVDLRADYVERAAELIEARQMAGAGPWLVAEAREQVNESGALKLEEANPIVSQGAYGDIELALQNVEWRREINLSWLEFSRWGIQQIILISRLYYIKNPILRRLIDIAATYVFGRGVEVSSTDEDANDVLKEFFERNKKTLGQIALVELEKRKYYDGNLFFAFFADAVDTGQTTVRTIDATEIMDIITDPDDTDKQWYYRRSWNQRIFDQANGSVRTDHKEAWYPALGFDPAEKPSEINKLPVNWDTPVLHRKCGNVAKWNFGCPIIYPALDWAKAARKYLEACATVKQALARFAVLITSKGGQQAIEGIKTQLGTTVGPGAPLWDTNPPPVNASILASGPGTTLQAFNTKGAGGDPEEVRRYTLMCCMVVGVPETFLADVSTGNLATATTLDRPTELVFAEKQEAWREDLATISQFVLKTSLGAPSGKLREGLKRRHMATKGVTIMEASRRLGPDGKSYYVWERATPEHRALLEAKAKKQKQIQVLVTFPAIREGDVPQMVKAIAESMTLDNKGGQIVGIDEKTGVGLLYKQLGVENSEDILEQQYPEGEYDPDRTVEPEPIMPLLAQPNPGNEPQLPGGKAVPTTTPKAATESVLAAAGRIQKLGERILKRTNGHAPEL